MIKNRMSRRAMMLSAALLTGGVLVSAVPAQEADYPTRAVTLVVPFAAGGGTDILARKVAQGISQALGQPVVVENRPGAGSLIGVSYVANAEPDGYTLLMASSSFVTNVIIGEEQPYDPLTALDPVTLVSMSPTVLAVHPSVEAQTLAEFIADAKANPGKYNYGTFGDRSQPHLSSVLFASEAGIELNGIPYNGGGPAVTAVVSGEVDMLMPTVMLVQPHIESGALRALALAASERSDLVPDVPTFNEAGFPFEMGTWFGVAAPAGTDRAYTSKVNDAIVAFINSEEMRAEIEGDGSVLMSLELDAFAEFIADEAKRWSAVKEQGLF